MSTHTGGPAGTSSQDRLIAETNADGLFVRQASGLVREIGWRETFAISASIIAFILLFFNFSAGLSASTHGDFYLPVIVAGVAAVFTGLTYTQLVSAMSRSGGDYVFASRVGGAVIGAAVGGALLLFLLLSGGGNALLFTQLGLPYFLRTAGDALGVHFLETFANTVSTKTGNFITASVVVLLLGLFATRSVRHVTRLVYWSFALAFLAWAIAIVELLVHSRSDFISAYNAASTPNAYAAIQADAHKAGLHTGATFAGMLAVYAWAYLAFNGFTLGVAAGGEVRRPGRTFRTVVLAACAVGTFVGLLSWAASRHIAGLDFLQASSWLSANDPTQFGHRTGINPLLGGLAYSTVVSGDPVTKLIIVLGLLAAVVGAVLSLLLLTSRVLFALSFDRLLPTRLADVNQRTHAPVNAIAVTVVGMLIWSALGSYTSFLTVFRNSVLVGYALFTLASVWGILLPYRRPELFASAGKVIDRRWFGVPAPSVIAAVSLVVNGGVVYLTATKTAISGGYSFSSILTLVVVATAGLVFYGISRVYFARRGLNVNMVMHELPPE